MTLSLPLSVRLEASESSASSKISHESCVRLPGLAFATLASLSFLLSMASLSSLPDVLVQLIMQFGTTPEIGRLARCSRGLCRAADAPVAFRFASVQVRSSTLISSRPPSLNSVCRHAALSLRWKPAPALQPLLNFLCAWPGPLRVLDSRQGKPSDDQWIMLLSSPRIVESLRELHLDSRGTPVSSQLMDLIVSLPRLHTLSIPPFDRGVVGLSRCSSLTSLSIRDCGAIGAPELTEVERLPGLRHLNIQEPKGLSSSEARLSSFCGSLAQLRSLAISEHRSARFSVEQPSVFERGFASLVCLESLVLRSVFRINWLLPALAHLSALRSLVIVASLTRADQSTHPAAAVLHALLAACPALHCSIQFSSSPDGLASARFLYEQHYDADWLKSMQPLLNARYELWPPNQ